MGHSSTSALFAQSPIVHAYAAYMSSKSAPMAIQMTAAYRRWGADTTNTHETAYNQAFDTDLSFFEHLSRDATRMNEFARYLQSVRSSEGVDLKHLVAGFD